MKMEWEGDETAEAVISPVGSSSSSTTKAICLSSSSPQQSVVSFKSTFKSSKEPEVVGPEVAVSNKEGGQYNHHHSRISFEELPTDLSNPKNHKKKNKPIPPPLDLSIGATNNTTTNNQESFHQPPPRQPSSSHNNCSSSSSSTSGSPKFTQSDKNLPLRKRWHSWSPVPMNGQEDSSNASSSPSCLLYPPDHTQSIKHQPQHQTGLTGGGDPTSPSSQPQTQQHQYMNPHHTHNHHHHHQQHLPPTYSSHHHPNPPQYTPRTPSAPTTTWQVLDFHALATPTSAGNNNNNNPPNGLQRLSLPPSNGHSDSLHTPTAFFTPNEPSPKFMNSPVFSYSNPDTSLYQGPFSPVRASSLYPPPSSPFTNLSLNSPLHTPQTPSSGGGGGGSGGPSGGGIPPPSSATACFNIVPSTLLSPAPSQASTNSLSYEDLHEKSLNFFAPAWSIFMNGTKVRFVSGMNSMDWYLVDFLAQSGESLGLKGEYAPHGLEVRKFVKTSSPKERIRVTFSPVAAPNHPQVEIDCEPGHPFMVDKKGWCALKPEIFQEIYGTQCQPLECGDICLSLGASRSPSIFMQHQQHLTHHLHTSVSNASGNPSNVLSLTVMANGTHPGLNHHQLNGSNGISIKMEAIDEKMVPISILPQNHQHHHHPHNIHQLQSMPNSPNNNNNNNNNNNTKKGTFASPIALQKNSSNTASNKKLKRLASDIKFQTGNAGGGAGGGNPNNTNGGVIQPPAEKVKGRRPMNAFLLFAKDKRPELIQMYPGKDNRSISVLLGEAWQSLAPVEREKYALNAKARAEEQKRIHPDCWKRKRSQSTNSQ